MYGTIVIMTVQVMLPSPPVQVFRTETPDPVSTTVTCIVHTVEGGPALAWERCS